MTQRSATSFTIPSDVWVGLVTLAGGVLYWQVADRIPISPLDGQVNAAMLPKTFAYILVGLSLLMVLRALLVEAAAVRAARKLMEGGSAPAPKGGPTKAKRFTMDTHLRAAGMLGLGLAFLLILPHLGYIISIMLLIGSVSLFMGAKAELKTFAIAIGAGLIFYLIFVYVLAIPLPAGFWPSLLR